MFQKTDRQRAAYLLEVRARGKYTLWQFAKFNTWRYIILGAYTICAMVYLARKANLFGEYLLGIFVLGILVTDFS